jgi:hypothetical protein
MIDGTETIINSYSLKNVNLCNPGYSRQITQINVSSPRKRGPIGSNKSLYPEILLLYINNVATTIRPIARNRDQSDKGMI